MAWYNKKKKDESEMTIHVGYNGQISIDPDELIQTQEFIDLNEAMIEEFTNQ